MFAVIDVLGAEGFPWVPFATKKTRYKFVNFLKPFLFL